MRPLSRSLPRSEVSRLLDVSPELIDALLDSGRILCRMQRGETLVPLDQLESFFREALVSLYRAEAELALPPRTAQQEPAPASMPEPPRPAPQEASETRTTAPSRAETPVAPIEPGVNEDVASAAEAQPMTRQSPDQRLAARYVPLRQINGILNDMKFTIIQLSASGLRIRHNEPIVPGTEGKLSFALLKPARSFVVRVRVVWTSLARSGDDRVSISGLRVIEHGERLARAIQLLNAAHELQPERRTVTRRSDEIVSTLDGVSDDEIGMITAAMQRFATDPTEASRWYSRARFALADDGVRRAAPDRPRDREEVLGIWEYLDRQVEIPKIAGVMSWMRQAT